MKIDVGPQEFVFCGIGLNLLFAFIGGPLWAVFILDTPKNNVNKTYCAALTVADFIITGESGLSPESVFTFPIASTTSCPTATFPKMV